MGGASFLVTSEFQIVFTVSLSMQFSYVESEVLTLDERCNFCSGSCMAFPVLSN